MKYKKYSYILVLILMLLVGINEVDAMQEKKCYYMSESGTFKARLTIKWRNGFFDGDAGAFLSDYAPVSIDKMGEGNYAFDKEGIINWWKTPNVWPRKECISGKSVCFEFKYNNIFDADVPDSEPTCPKYLVLENNGQNAVWATDTYSYANKAQTEIRKNGYIGYYGEQVEKDEYFKEFIAEGLIKYDDKNEPTCAEYEAIFGELKDDGKTYDPDGDKQPSIRYYVNQVLQYVRIIVPILIIVLGTVDFAKAVLAGKEDNMRKAQSDFVKRVLIGVAVFFVPLLVNVIMELADIVWAGEYVHCDL